MTNKTIMQEFFDSSYLSGASAEYVEGLYDQFLSSPEELEPKWRDFFVDMTHSMTSTDVSHAAIREAFKVIAKQPVSVVESSDKQPEVDAMIDAFRRMGYRYASSDPFPQPVQSLDSRLTLAGHGLYDNDLSGEFDTRGILPSPRATLKEIHDRLHTLYLGSVGYDVAHVLDGEESAWLQHQIEQAIPARVLPESVRKQSLKKLVQANTLERYLEKKYVAQKRFSLEGCDALVPMLDRLITLASELGTKELIFGMAHRGRVNVLINNLGMNPGVLYEDFEGPAEFGETTGDLKYHRGFSSDLQTESGVVHLSLMFNPSHLEYISPVVMGSVRARQEKHQSAVAHDYAIPVLMHGDAAFSGEGIVMETLSMSQLRAYNVGGSIHIITNNHIGFTTRDDRDNRSSFSCADAAKMIDAPIFHVNADDGDAVLRVLELAFAYRVRFHKDVVIDLSGYRRHGHQEADEPAATAPLLYKKIRQHPRACEIYAAELIQQGVLSEADVKEWEKEYRVALDAPRSVIPLMEDGLSVTYKKNWDNYIGKQWGETTDTSYPAPTLTDLATTLYQIPEGFNLQKQVSRMVGERQKMAAGERSMDWGFGETMAYATLLKEGHRIRLIGQDTRRGTFSHRHSSLFDQETAQEYVALQEFADDESQLSIYDSPLNEAGALGFEYGHTVADPNTLVIWEAQFGDFYNPAQVIVDQFISSGWQKWQRLSGLVMFLPHGLEGQGPEHSSARIERFLQLCAQQNMQIFVPSTPAQIYHLIRRQALRPYRRPLIVMTPKSLLRHKLAVSAMSDLSHGQLQTVIPEHAISDDASVKRVVVCSGKVYFDLLEKRMEACDESVAIVRVEQLYPFPYDELKTELKRYSQAKEVVWCQEEPKNQGPWFVTRHRLVACLAQGQALAYVGREPFAAPASGYIKLHQMQQKALVDQALDLSVSPFSSDVVLSENE